MIKVSRPEDVTREAIEAVAYEGEPLELHPGLLEGLGGAHEAMLSALAAGKRVYGVNTGAGFMAKRGLSGPEQVSYQHNLLLGRAVGSPPFLPWEEARLVLVARLASFLSGHAGVTPELCRFLVDRLNDGFTPAIPRSGMGSAGEVIPLSHAFQTFLGIGSVLDVDGNARDAGAALAERGVAPYEPAPKEGIALLAGSPGAVALAVARRRTAGTLFRQLLTGTACAINAIQAPMDIYSEDVGRLSNDPMLVDVLAQLRAALSGSTESTLVTQAPVSFRVAPQLLTHLRRAISRLTGVVERALGSVSDSPAFVGGRFVATGGFHEVELAAGIDECASALIRTAELSVQRMHRLLDGRFSGLPDQLTPDPGPQAGLIVVHKRAVGVMNELRRLSIPASLGVVDTSLGQEDAMTFVFEASEKLRRVELLVRDVAACELLVVRQAWALRGEPAPEGLREIAWRITETVDPVNEDRPLGTDVTRLAEMLERNELPPLD